MTKSTLPAMDTKDTKGSLTKSLVRTFLLVVFIPVAVLAGLLYFRIRALLVEINAPTLSAQLTELTIFTILVALGVLGLLYALLNWVAKRFIEPIQALAIASRRFTDGDWTQRADTSSNDEVGVIASSFNHMAEQLGEVYQSLEKKVDERARQIRTAAEVAQNVTTSLNLDDMLNKTTELLVQEFGFYQASIFLIDRGGKYADFKSGSGPATRELINKKYRLEVGSASIVGWVAAKNQARITSNVFEDPLHLRNELLPETKAEAT
ncbi:MAG TPA: HAMP domain-containing protein, partial [Anaerolineales bacterium]|nr:HAMP domain-containing protein [Anaerolineales bacterium]